LAFFPINAENWQQGVALETYGTGMQTYRADMERRMAEVHLTVEDSTRLQQLQRPVKLAVLSEDWCIDCLMTLPIAAQMAAVAPTLEMRIFSRNKWWVLKEFFNERGIMAIPVYAFLTPEFEEFATFVERPQPATERLNAWKAAHPEVDELRRSFSLTNQQKSARLATIRQGMQVEMEEWYRNAFQSAMVAEFATLLGI